MRWTQSTPNIVQPPKSSLPYPIAPTNYNGMFSDMLDRAKQTAGCSSCGGSKKI